MSVVSSDAEQHNREIHENRKAWARKPVLRRAYAELYRAICENIEPSIPGSKVELGSGMGNIQEITFRNASPPTCFPTPGWTASRMHTN